MPTFFYIGIALIFISFIPWFYLNGKIMRDRKEYEKFPLKMQEIEATYRRNRLYLGLFQIACIILAMIGLLI